MKLVQPYFNKDEKLAFYVFKATLSIRTMYVHVHRKPNSEAEMNGGF